MQEEMKTLYHEIQSNFPENQARLELYPGGAAFLEVKIGDETYVMEYHLSAGIGISRMSTAGYGWEGYEHPFDAFRPARECLLALLRAVPDTIAPPPVRPNQRMQPPQPDSTKTLLDGTIRAESRGHFSYYLPDGGIQIVEKTTGRLIFEK